MDVRNALVFDSTLTNIDTARVLIEAALNGGKFVQIAYVHRPVELAMKFAIERATRKGMFVAPARLGEDHWKAQNTLLALASEYATEPAVTFVLFDNRARKEDIARIKEGIDFFNHPANHSERYEDREATIQRAIKADGGEIARRMDARNVAARQGGRGAGDGRDSGPHAQANPHWAKRPLIGAHTDGPPIPPAPLARLHHLRQQFERAEGERNLCLADYIAPRSSGRLDYIGGFTVTAGDGVEKLAAGFKRAGDDYHAIMTQALGDRIAEALAEKFHKHARDLCGYGRAENLTPEDLIRERYRGIRPAPGYPACPDHTEKQTLFRFLDTTAATGVRLTESCAMTPGSSVSGWYFNHPAAKYFGVGKLARDQVEDYAKRKQMPLPDAERWLGPWLDYAP